MDVLCAPGSAGAVEHIFGVDATPSVFGVQVLHKLETIDVFIFLTALTITPTLWYPTMVAAVAAAKEGSPPKPSQLRRAVA
ncbi:hypothetical protein DFH09DRAFT_1332559 [Mycena vulgaris]|nr:hypothetical protein DFH09DRAFT_1332559 [Mycena vulgaris]